MKKRFRLWVLSQSTLKKLIMELKIVFPIIMVIVSNVMAIPTYSEVTKVSIDREIFLSTDPMGTSVLPNTLGTELQQKQITGNITDETGGPLPGVNIQIEGSTIGAISDASGKYSINVPNDNVVLIFSFIGYNSQRISTTGKTILDVKLVPSLSRLEEVVVVGYGVQKKANVIGSVTTISNAELKVAPVAQLSNMLSGRLPGAIVQQRSGEPGKDAADILIRGRGTLGDNSPLVIIDGIQGRDLNLINSNDVESISVLKDASASIYGSRAANGVILITTKRGNEGPARISYDLYEGLLTPTKLPEMADAETFASMIRERQVYRNTPESRMLYSLEDIEKYRSGEYPWTHPNTDWYDATLAKFSRTRHHNLSITGGNQNAIYYVAFGAHYDGGIYKQSSTSYNRYNVKANVDVKLNKYLNIGIDLDGSMGIGKYSALGAGAIYTNGIARELPVYAAYWPNGLPGPDVEGGNNPVVTSTSATGFNHTDSYITNNKFTANFKVPWIEGLTLSSYYAFDLSFGVRKQFRKQWFLYNLDEGAYLAAGNTGKEDGSDFLVGSPKGPSDPNLRNTYSKELGKTFNIKAEYDKTINGIHNINVFIAFESSQFDYNGISAYRRYFVSDKLPYLFAGGTLEQENSEDVSIDANLNYFGRLNYNYKETYLVEFTFRRDGSLRFSKEIGRWGNFPSVLVGWRVSNESFWKDRVQFMDYLKLKASWGMMGNDLVSPFQYLTNYEFASGLVLGNDKRYSLSLAQSGAPNPQITWETAKTYNVGFESRLFENKVTFNTDFFYQRRSDILVQRNASVPNSTGLTLPDENFGIVDNRGFELELGYSQYDGPFTYGVNGNFAFARNKVVEFDEPAQNVEWQVLTGHPQGSVLVYHSLGVFKDAEAVEAYPHVSGAGPGDIIIEDYDKNEEITSDDKILLDMTEIPEITYGVSFFAGYKNLRLTGQIQGVGNTIIRIMNSLQGQAGNFYKFDTEDRWTPENTDASNPRAFERVREYWRDTYATDHQWHNAAFARMKNLQLSYTLPSSFLRSVDAQLYLSGQNLFFLYTGNKLMDPELSDITQYPIMKVFTLGARISF